MRAAIANLKPLVTPDEKFASALLRMDAALLVAQPLLIASLSDAVGGTAIMFADGTADFTDADSTTLAAICSLVATEGVVDGLPPVQ